MVKRVTEKALENLVGTINGILWECQGQVYERYRDHHLIVYPVGGYYNICWQENGATTHRDASPATSIRETYFWLRGILFGLHMVSGTKEDD